MPMCTVCHKQPATHNEGGVMLVCDDCCQHNKKAEPKDVLPHWQKGVYDLDSEEKIQLIHFVLYRQQLYDLIPLLRAKLPVVAFKLFGAEVK